MAHKYCGRFAPSPTGPLHFGSLVTALASFLDARAKQGRWLVRMEDIDFTRCLPGLDQDILSTLADFGLEWDGEVLYQNQPHSQQRYQAALQQLRDHGLTYLCGCSRKEIADSAQQGIEGPVYPGTCRNGLAPGKAGRAERIKVPQQDIGFVDRIQGPLNQNLAHQIGDFVLRRADGCFSYQLAVVADDAWQGVTDVVRGIDLLLSTPRQLYLQQVLGLAQPGYAHIPLAVNQLGLKLSKQNLARAVDRQQPVPVLYRALLFLGQAAPAEAQHWSRQRLLDWAIANWQLERVPRQQQIVCETVDSLPKKMLDGHQSSE
ncbi:MAG: tRNA glutamyl-Q(34) synthetase GluQRS [Chitinivorax sp.]